MKMLIILIFAFLLCGFSLVDFDQDGDVDGLDLAIIAKDFGSVSCDASFSWTANIEGNLAGYRVYYGRESRKYDGFKQTKETTIILTFHPEVTFFTATAVDTDGFESEYSDEVFYKCNQTVALASTHED